MNDLSAQLDRIESLLLQQQQQVTGIPSPWLRGDKAGAEYAGFKSVRGFLAWARSRGIRPDKSDGINFWSRRDIDGARERGRA
jgi:hypothetical protein